jgi:DNA-binding GntR family transcriptional regulator
VNKAFKLGKSVTPIYPLKRPRTLTEQAADAIRTRIVTGDFQLGEALSEITLAAELGVSKTPVREAFLQLKNEGLVDIQPQRGTFVFQMTPEQIRQLTVLRELLEVQALRTAMETNHVALSQGLEEVVAAMRSAVGKADIRLYRELDHDFHQRIIAAAANEFIGAAYSSIAFRVQALRNRLSLEAQQNERSLREHIALAHCVGTGDAEQGAVMIVDHIRITTREYMKVAQEQMRDSAVAGRSSQQAKLRAGGLRG